MSDRRVQYTRPRSSCSSCGVSSFLTPVHRGDCPEVASGLAGLTVRLPAPPAERAYGEPLSAGRRQS